MKKIRNKITILLAGGIFLTLLPLSFVIVRQLQQQALEDLKNVALIMADFISEAVSESVLLEDQERINLALEAAKRKRHVVFVQVYNIQGILLASYATTPLVPDMPPEMNGSVPRSYDTGKGVVVAMYPIPGQYVDKRGIIGMLMLGVSTKTLEERTKNFQIMGGIFGGIFFLLSSIIAWMIGTNIANPVVQLSTVARQIAGGDLSQTVSQKIHLSDEIGELAQSFDYMRESLQGLIRHIRHAGLRMQSSSDEIFMAVNQLAAVLEEQSASMLETTTMMESVTDTSRKITKNTDAVVNMAERTRTHSQKGVGIAEETIKKMREIDETNTRFLQKITTLGERSEKIGAVIQLIHDIADRTKLIAFNAALEAVEAKDTLGKRFNVVAIEIRRLADTIIESTQEIEDNILEIQQGIRELVLSSDITTMRIAEGARQTETSAEWLREILDAAIHTNNEAKQIASSIQEQQFGNEQILLALKEISDGTKQFVSAGNKASSSANEMKRLAEEFYRLIDKFELDREENEQYDIRRT